MKKMRKGFTLVELLVVIAILGVLAAGMSVSSAKATMAAKVTTIYNNINAIKTAALIYQLNEGLGFKEENVTAKALKDAELIDVDDYNKGKDGKETLIRYAIVEGNTANGTGAYVICTFLDDTDYEDIAESLSAYKNIRIEKEKDYTVGAFLYHNTPAEFNSEVTYDIEFKYPASESTGG